MKSQNYCMNYVQQIFEKWDKDNSGVLDRQQLKNWMREEIKEHPRNKTAVKEQFNTLLHDADGNGDGKLDRWELFHYCLRNHHQDEE